MGVYQQCSKCILDINDDPNISFDGSGVCNYCNSYDRIAEEHLFKSAQKEKKLAEIIASIKNAGRNNKYDCILGVSGGVDSTYLAYKINKFGFRPLAVHLDNGWNSEIAVKNIDNVIKKLKFDLYTHVIDREEFRNLQLAYLKASVVDVEAITDHAIMAILYRMATHNRIRYIISGANIVTESILPQHWYFNKGDHKNIKAINKEYGAAPLKTFPLFDSISKFRCFYTFKISNISLLDYIAYNKDEAKKIITQELDWHDYGGKHYESIFTRFYQGYILPRKFGIDKRKAHLSNLICSGQIARDRALEEFKKPAYDPEQFKVDYIFVLKKLDLSSDEFEKIMDIPIREHTEFPIEKPLHTQPFLRVIKLLRDSLRINSRS